MGIARLSYIEALNSLKRRDPVHVLPKRLFPTLSVTLATPRKEGAARHGTGGCGCAAFVLSESPRRSLMDGSSR